MWGGVGAGLNKWPMQIQSGNSMKLSATDETWSTNWACDLPAKKEDWPECGMGSVEWGRASYVHQ